MRSAKQIERNCGSEDRPVVEQPVDVAQLALLVSPGPPVRGEAEGQVDEPDDPEPQHPEEHSRADRARRRLAREPRAAPRVQPERQQERDLGENPERVEDTLVPLRLRDEVRAEDRAGIEGGEREIVGNRGRIEEERPDCECRDDERREDASQRAPPRSGAVPGGRMGLAPTGSRSRRIGPPYG